MDKYKIISDSTTDLPVSFFHEHDIDCMNLSYMIDDATYGGETGQEMDSKKFYSYMRAGHMPVTSQVNPDAAKLHIERYIGEYEKILVLSFSSGLSGTYNSARLAAEELMEEHPECKITVIDSLCASLGEGLFLHKAVCMKEEGKSMEEVAKWLNDHIQNFVHIFTVDDLNHLYRGGRVSKTTAFLGTLAGIKPILHVDKEGHLIAIDKVRGRKKSLNSLVDYMESHMGEYRDQNNVVFISHGDALEDAEFVADEIKKRFGIDNFLINQIGPTIGTHAGPGTIALFFLGTER